MSEENRVIDLRNAHVLRDLHQANVTPAGGPVCVWCQERWPCTDARWAESVLRGYGVPW